MRRNRQLDLKWAHPANGVYWVRVLRGVYMIERDIVTRLWQAWWLPDAKNQRSPSRRVSLGHPKKLSLEAKGQCTHHLHEQLLARPTDESLVKRWPRRV